MEAILEKVRQAWYLHAVVFNGKRRRYVLFVEREGRKDTVLSILAALMPERDCLERHLDVDVIFRQHLRVRL